MEAGIIEVKKKYIRKKCPHNKRKTECKDCRGSSICEHNKRKSTCKDCRGSQICQHNRVKSKCKDCRGSQICSHNRQKSACKDCRGSGICQHNKRKSRCKDCDGSDLCEHNRQKSMCIICGGSQICEHNKQKSQCKQCGGSALCKNDWCEVRASKKYEGYCMPCFVNNPENRDKPAMRNYKTKEKTVVDAILQKYKNFHWICDKRVADGCSKRRPDLLLDVGSHIIIIEVDENKHSSYECSCENKRLMELSKDLYHRPIVFIRFNPDSYKKSDGILVKSCWKLNKTGIISIMKTKEKEWLLRIETLLSQIQYWLDNPTTKTIEIIELFY